MKGHLWIRKVTVVGIAEHSSTVCSWQAYPLIKGLSFLDVLGNWMHPARKGPSRLQVLPLPPFEWKYALLSITGHCWNIAVVKRQIVCNACDKLLLYFRHIWTSASESLVSCRMTVGSCAILHADCDLHAQCSCRQSVQRSREFCCFNLI